MITGLQLFYLVVPNGDPDLVNKQFWRDAAKRVTEHFNSNKGVVNDEQTDDLQGIPQESP